MTAATMNPDECRSIASEGERALREGDATKGIKVLEQALVGASGDLMLLASLHSQLGNAYYARRDYTRARFHHLNDLYASRLQKDDLQQAKAYSNLSATYTLLADFDNAIVCANNVISIARKLEDKALECRGIYNLGLAYLHCATQGVCGHQDELQLRNNLQHASDCFKKHLVIAEQRQDRILCGLGLGNLGNTCFYMGDYRQSIEYHEKRIELARELGDHSSIRRSYTNIANAHALLGDFDSAINFYSMALELAREMGAGPELEQQLVADLENAQKIKMMKDSTRPKRGDDELTCSASVNTSFGFGAEFSKMGLSDVTNNNIELASGGGTDVNYDDDELLLERIELANNMQFGDQRVEFAHPLMLAGAGSLKDASHRPASSRRFSLSKSRLRPMMKSLSSLPRKIGHSGQKQKQQPKQQQSSEKKQNQQQQNITMSSMRTPQSDKFGSGKSSNILFDDDDGPQSSSKKSGETGKAVEDSQSVGHTEF